MPIRWDKRNRRWRYEFDRYIAGVRQRTTRLLPAGWSQAQADAYDRAEGGRLYAVATGVGQADPLIESAVALYLKDKRTLKSHRQAAEHLAAIAWAYMGQPMSALARVAAEVNERRHVEACTDSRGRVRAAHDLADATVKQRLALLKAACRWAWKAHHLTPHDPTARMVLPAVSNERHVYRSRLQMLQACRACTNRMARVAIRVAFYSGLRLGEQFRVEPQGDVLLLADTKNGDRRAVPVHPRIAHLVKHLPLTDPKITVQRAWERARDKVGLQGTHLHDLRHSTASEMINAGVDLYTVGQVLGHRDPRSTARYAHLSLDAMAVAVRKIGRKAPHTGTKKDRPKAA